MSIRATTWAWTAQTTPTAKLVLLALADFADETGHCWPRVALLVEMTCLSERDGPLFVACEQVDDLALIYGDRVRFVQLKTPRPGFLERCGDVRPRSRRPRSYL